MISYLLREQQKLHLSINDRDKEGSSSIEYAVRRGRLDAVTLLLKHGARITGDKETRSLASQAMSDGKLYLVN